MNRAKNEAKQLWRREDGSPAPDRPRFGRDGLLTPLSAWHSPIGFAWVVRVDAPAKKLSRAIAARIARDIEDVHRWTSATLNEHGVRLPTVVVAALPKLLQPHRDAIQRALHEGDNAAATWLVAEGSIEQGGDNGSEEHDSDARREARTQARAVVEDLLNPEIVGVKFKARTEADFQEVLRSWSSDQALQPLAPLLTRIANHPRWSPRSNILLEEFRNRARDKLHGWFEDHLQGRPEPSTIEAINSAVVQPGAHRLRSLRIENIGGIKGPLTLQLGRHITIVLAGNGIGKSSITNGLLRVLTGSAYWNDRDLCRQDRAGATNASIGVEREDGGSDDKIELEPGEDPEDGIRVDSTQVWWADDAMFPPDEMRDLTGQADQQIERRIMDDKRSAILQTLRPRTPREDALWELIRESRGDRSTADKLVDERLNQLEEEDELAEQIAARAQEVAKLRDAGVEAVRQHLQHSSGHPALGRIIAQLDRLKKAEPDTFGEAEHQPTQEFERLQTSLKDLLRRHSGAARTDRSLAEVEADLREARSQAVEHRAVLKWLGGSTEEDAVSLAAVLQQLAEGRARWSAVPDGVPEHIYAPVRESFAAIDAEDLDALRQHVDRSTTQAQQALERLRVLSRQRDALLDDSTEVQQALERALQALEDWLTRSKVDWNNKVMGLRDAHRAVARTDARNKERSYVRGIQRSIIELRGRMAAENLEELTGRIQRATNQVIRRYGTIGTRLPMKTSDRIEGEGPIRLTLDSSDRMKLRVDDADRPIQTLSTGQKHQLTLARVIAERQLVQSSDAAQYLGHRLLILDDVASSHDEDAVAREALILRQLAYHPKDKVQVQLLVLTHHRRLARRYCQLLAPPQDCELRLVELSPGEAEGVVHIEERPQLHSEKLDSINPEHLLEPLFRTLCFGRSDPTPEAA